MSVTSQTFVCLRDSRWSFGNTKGTSVGSQQRWHGPLLAGCSTAQLHRDRNCWSYELRARSYANTVNIKGAVISFHVPQTSSKARQIISVTHNNMVDTDT